MIPIIPPFASLFDKNGNLKINSPPSAPSTSSAPRKSGKAAAPPNDLTRLSNMPPTTYTASLPMPMLQAMMQPTTAMLGLSSGLSTNLVVPQVAQLAVFEDLLLPASTTQRVLNPAYKPPGKQEEKRKRTLPKEPPIVILSDSPELDVSDGPSEKRNSSKFVKEPECPEGYVVKQIKQESVDEYKYEGYSGYQPRRSPSNAFVAPEPLLPQRPEVIRPTPIAPNKVIYAKLRKAFPYWRFEIIKSSVLDFHLCCMFKRELLQLFDGDEEELAKTDKMFEDMKELMVQQNLNPQQNEIICRAILHQLTSWQQFLATARKQYEPKVRLFYYISQIPDYNFSPTIKHSQIKLPSYEEVEQTIEDALSTVIWFGFTEEQKATVIRAFKDDWSDPSPGKVRRFARKIGVSSVQLLTILKDARRNLDRLISARNYYWAIESDIPVFT